MRIGLVLGLINEKMNQMMTVTSSDEKKEDEEVIHGDGSMLMKM